MTSLSERRTRLLGITAVTLLLAAVVVSFLYNYGMATDYANRDDLQIASEVADYIKLHTSKNDEIFIFELNWPRLGPLIYFLSERLPALPRPFYFTHIPDGVTLADVEAIERALTEKNVTHVVVIGYAPPPSWNSTKILLIFNG